METLEIQNCYDSHTHFVATGQTSLGLKLQDLKTAQDIQSKKINSEAYQGHWIVGFGWDHNRWISSALPTKDILDKIFPETPVLLSRVDGHASWLNSCALAELKKNHYDFTRDPVGGQIMRDSYGDPTGVLLDQAHIMALMKLPAFSEAQLKTQIKESIKIFNQAGFTHIRDLSMNHQTAALLHDLYGSKNLTLCLDGFVTAENVNDLERTYLEFQKCKSINNPFLRFHGLKIFVDGSLGSETALISKNYIGRDHHGLISWAGEEIRAAIHFCWSRKIDIAVHTIGDAAVDLVVHAAREVSAAGILGKMHLEHVQILRPSTVQLMKPLHVYCHLQPCHWLNDKTWIQSKIGPLTEYLFQWELLRKNKIPFSFGSDSPIEQTSLIRNLQALKESVAYGIPALRADPRIYHAHPDLAWTKSKTLFNEHKILEVFFDGEKII